MGLTSKDFRDGSSMPPQLSFAPHLNISNFFVMAKRLIDINKIFIMIHCTGLMVFSGEFLKMDTSWPSTVLGVNNVAWYILLSDADWGCFLVKF